MMDWTCLHTTAFLLRNRPGKIDEYRRWDAKIRPEMLAATPADGVLHYNICVHKPSSAPSVTGCGKGQKSSLTTASSQRIHGRDEGANRER